jgi:UDP-2-acetamido-3-amino-2,3-dideoxy-glucuronate N-acetyltransferase
MVGKIEIIEDERGCLMPFGVAIIPFDVVRVFTVEVEKESNRGFHAHFYCHQFLICLKGGVVLELHNGKEKETIYLNKGNYYHINPMIWAHQEYLNNSMLMVLCSHEYDKEDYITDFEEFKRLINGN